MHSNAGISRVRFAIEFWTLATQACGAATAPGGGREAPGCDVAVTTCWSRCVTAGRSPGEGTVGDVGEWHSRALRLRGRYARLRKCDIWDRGRG
ncbi:hypothetical protein BS50DRAFT_232534 [Corynespora cassiicola Philippines]|uniref:Secreted protein n=1 Tax=Corynespora cassiicola Philippines TaxID=1448308 RepID=A0A2T2P2A6_CORCC|nr:hypothetical protein BS50DRAFT_232534 [Corynespora cassiicola Philippines]